VGGNPVRASSAHPSISSGNDEVGGLAVPRSPYVFVEQVCARYGVSRRWVHERTRLNEIPHRRLPGTRRCLFLETELEAWEAGATLEVRELTGGGRIVTPKQC
jgi:predicted DNA-binding transcriptional regulator AlpA